MQYATAGRGSATHLTSELFNMVAGIKTVRAHGNEDYEGDRTASIVRNAFRTYLRRRRVETRYSLIQNLLIYGSKGIVLGVGGMRALEHQLTPGDVVMFMAYLDRIYSPVHNLTGLYSGTLNQVLARVLDGNDFVVEISGDGVNIVVIGTSGMSGRSSATLFEGAISTMMPMAKRERFC